MKMQPLTSYSKIVLVFLSTLFLLSCNPGSQSSTETVESQEEASADFQISLAQWSLHKSFFGPALQNWDYFDKLIERAPDSLIQGVLDPTDFPSIAAGYGIYSIELVNTFYFTRAEDMEYWKGFKKKCEDAGVSVGLIMCDRLGDLGNADAEARKVAVENHYKWVEVAKFLGAHSIRVNAAGQGTAEEVAAHAAEGLASLGEYGASRGINIIVENHGGYSSDGQWLSGVMKKVGMDNVGTLPDFGNFCVEESPEGCKNEYDRYKGVSELMPFAKGVSAKALDFDAEGNEVHTDFQKMMKIVKDSGFKGYVGIEFEGGQLSEDEGIKATKALLEKVFKAL